MELRSPSNFSLHKGLTLRLFGLLGLFVFTVSSTAWAQKPAREGKSSSTPGMLSEIKPEFENEEASERRAIKGEVLISNAEEQALQSLLRILERRKGTAQEPDLLYRLAELHMRRSKSGRFFDLWRSTDKASSIAPPKVRDQSAREHIQKAIAIYRRLEKDYPKFPDLDQVLFNGAFAQEQLGNRSEAGSMYKKLLTQFPQSQLVTEANLALGEILYDQQRFNEAIPHFRKVEETPTSRVYSYGIYKLAWTLYNLKQARAGQAFLEKVVQMFDPRKSKDANTERQHNLRSEALRDLVLFSVDSINPKEAVGYFTNIATPEELPDVMVNLAKLFEGYSRFSDLELFVSEYINEVPNGPARVRLELILIQSLEALKKRPEVLQRLEALAQVCRPGSAFRTTQDLSGEQCTKTAAGVHLELAKKWWELWSKNGKQHRDLALLTSRAFEIHLEREDPLSPDIRSRYAFAELLFQLEEFDKASLQYETVYQRAKLAPAAEKLANLPHDSAYAALVAKQKHLEKSKKQDSDEVLRLCLQYLEAFPKGEHQASVRLQVGVLHYESKRWGPALTWLDPLARDSNLAASSPLKSKAQDLVLDIFNVQKDWNSLTSFAAQILTLKDLSPERRTQMLKLQEETAYAAIQESSKNVDPKAAADLYSGFANQFPKSPLAKESLWQSMSLYFAKSHRISGAKLALEFHRRYPEDPRVNASLLEAATTFEKIGDLKQAAEIWTLLLAREGAVKDARQVKRRLAAFYRMENQLGRARDQLAALLSNASPNEQAELHKEILSTFTPGSSEIEAYHLKLAKEGKEPWKSQRELVQVERLLEEGKFSAAFSSAMPIVGGSGDSQTRARARLVQAVVLEGELVRQSTKASLDRLPLVLGMKTEKLDKAQTAYVSAINLSADPHLQMRAMQGLLRSYKDYLSTVNADQVRDLPETEKKALETELAKLLAPIRAKEQEWQSQLAKLTSQLPALTQTPEATSSSASRTPGSIPKNPGPEKSAGAPEIWKALSPEASIRPATPALSADWLPALIPEFREGRVAGVLSPNKNNKCESEKLPARNSERWEVLAQCARGTDAAGLRRLAELAIDDDGKQTAWPLFFLSLIADRAGQSEKALLLVELALQERAKEPLLIYHRARLLLQLQEVQKAQELLQSLRAPEYLDLRWVQARTAYQNGKCADVLSILEEAKEVELDSRGFLPAWSECLASTGKIDRGLEALTSAERRNSKNIEQLLTKVRILEVYKLDRKSAIPVLERIKSITKDVELQDWIMRKLSYLSESSKEGPK